MFIHHKTAIAKSHRGENQLGNDHRRRRRHDQDHQHHLFHHQRDHNPKVKNGKNKLDSLEGEIEDSIEDIKPKVINWSCFIYIV